MGQHFKDLIAWQKAMELVEEIYKLTAKVPAAEQYGLVSQLRRAAVSVPSNIAEGQAHFHNREFLHFLRHARGSLAEVETQILLAARLHYITPAMADEISNRIAELGRILNGLIKSIPD